MLGLPKSTEIHKLITKKKVYEHFGADMSADRRKRFDADIARMTLANEVSPVSLNISAGDDVQNFFILHIGLKAKEFDPQNISFIARLFGQRLLMVLEAEGQQRLALWQTKLIMTEWAEAGSYTIDLAGLNLDRIWENIVTRIAGIEIQQGRTLDEEIAVAGHREKLQREIAKLEKAAWAEKQPKRKFELVQKIKALQAELEEL